MLLQERTWGLRWGREGRGLEVGTKLFSTSTEQDERGVLTLQLDKQKVRLLGHFLKLTGNTQTRSIGHWCRNKSNISSLEMS